MPLNHVFFAGILSFLLVVFFMLYNIKIHFSNSSGSIIILTGPTGSGKTDTSWELLKNFSNLVFLDCDWFASYKPFSWHKESDVQKVYDAIATIMKFHQKRGATHFVITLTSEMAEVYNKYNYFFKALKLPIYCFYLYSDQETLKERIFSRNRIQKEQELKDATEQKLFFDKLFTNQRLFKIIDTRKLTEQEVANTIMKEIT